MEYDIFESISQGEYGENATQNGRMEEVADFLFRSCANNEDPEQPKTNTIK